MSYFKMPGYKPLTDEEFLVLQNINNLSSETLKMAMDNRQLFDNEQYLKSIAYLHMGFMSLEKALFEEEKEKNE